MYVPGGLKFDHMMDHNHEAEFDLLYKAKKMYFGCMKTESADFTSLGRLQIVL